MQPSAEPFVASPFVVRPFPARLGAAFRETLVTHRMLIALTLGYAAVAIAATALWSKAATDEVLVAFPTSLIGSLIVIATVASLATLVYLVRHRPAHPFAALAREISRPGVWQTTVSRALVIVPLMVLFILCFCEMKSRIADFHAYSLDPAFVALDAVLHGGRQPWTWLQPIIGFPVATNLIDKVYYLWFPVIFATFYWQVFTLYRPALRLQFILAFAGSWMLIGTVAAIVLSSAGPVFLADLGFDGTPFTDLIAYLDRVDAEGYGITARTVQAMLWRTYATGAQLPFEGISAMPSMHVGIAVLLAIFGWRRDWRLGIAFSVFVAFIFVGSIHLGFHYAIDGYLAALMAAAIWWASGRIVRRTMAASAAP